MLFKLTAIAALLSVILVLSSNDDSALAFIVVVVDHHRRRRPPPSHRPPAAAVIARRTRFVALLSPSDDESQHPPSYAVDADIDPRVVVGEGGSHTSPSTSSSSSSSSSSFSSCSISVSDDNDHPVVRLLTAEERRPIDVLVAERSASRWAGDYSVADEMRMRLEGMRVVVPWERILRAASTAAAAAARDDDDDYVVRGVDEFRDLLLDARRRRGGDVDVGQEFRIVVADVPRSEGGRSKWVLVPACCPPEIDGAASNPDEDDVLRLAHAALGTAASASERGVDVDYDALNGLARRASRRLRDLRGGRALAPFLSSTAPSSSSSSSSAMTTMAGTGVGELHGRKAADAALWFALSGIDDVRLYDDLVSVATAELSRFGKNSGCRAKDVMHIVERVAMAGIGAGHSRGALYRVAADCLEIKMMGGTGSTRNDDVRGDDVGDTEGGGIDYGGIISSLRDGSFGLHSDRPLLGLWRFSTRQRKQRAFFRNAARHFDGQFRGTNAKLDGASSGSLGKDCGNINPYDWSAMFIDPSRPLVVDIGCGMGVSLLGLSSSRDVDDRAEIRIDWKDCNFIGVDISRLAVGYAQGVRSRMSLGDLTFVVDSAENCLMRIGKSYPGKVSLIMMQFPTPYRFQGNDFDENGASDDAEPSVARRGFNAQLPEGAASNDFMVTENLLSQIHDILSEDNGQLLIQSNCEDVAVHMRNVATKTVGFQSVSVSHSVTSLDVVTQRAQRWVDNGGERAIGRFWSAVPLLPLCGRTETEVACLLDGKPIHRCLLEVRRC